MKITKKIIPYILVGPAVMWVLVFSLWPFINTVILSFTDARPLRSYSFVGLENYLRLFEDPHFISAITVSLVYVVACVPLLTVLPLLLALLVYKKIPGIGFFRTTYYFPVIASVVVVGIIWSWIFNSSGIINQSLVEFGLADKPINFLTDRWKLVGCAVTLTVWKGLGYYMVVYLAALAHTSQDIHEAAALDGAGRLRRFIHITIPSVKLSMMLVSALICVAAMRIFAELYVLSGGTGGPGGRAQSIVMLISRTGSGLNGEVGYASALSVVLFFLTIGPLCMVAFLNYQGPERIAAWRNRSKKGSALPVVVTEEKADTHLPSFSFKEKADEKRE